MSNLNVPSNSDRSRRQDPTAPKVEDKKIEKIVSGPVERRKKTRLQRFHDVFFGVDAKTAMRDAFFETLIPSAQEAVLNSVNEGLQRMFFKEVRFPLRGPGSRMGMLPFNMLGMGQTNYANYAQGGGRVPNQKAPLGPGSRERAAFDFEQIVLATRVEALEVVDRLNGLVEVYGSASVADLYGFLGVTPEWTEVKWGWTDLSRAGVSHIRGGYVLNLPRPEPLPD